MHIRFQKPTKVVAFRKLNTLLCLMGDNLFWTFVFWRFGIVVAFDRKDQTDCWVSHLVVWAFQLRNVLTIIVAESRNRKPSCSKTAQYIDENGKYPISPRVSYPAVLDSFSPFDIWLIQRCSVKDRGCNLILSSKLLGSETFWGKHYQIKVINRENLEDADN